MAFGFKLLVNVFDYDVKLLFVNSRLKAVIGSLQELISNW